MEDVQVAVRAVNAYVKVTLTQDEFNALTDFCFNAGCHAFFCSTMLTLLNQGNYSAAAAQFIRWDKCGGVELAGLLRRRQAEMQEFMGHG
jgi:lysozyme